MAKTSSAKELKVADLGYTTEQFEKYMLHKLVDPVLKFFKKLWESAKQEVQDNQKAAKPVSRVGGQRIQELRKLQESLRLIPRYNADEVVRTGETIMVECKGLALNKILKLLFLTKSTILASIRPNTNDDEPMTVHVPKPHNYLHCVLKIAAKQIFEQPGMMQIDDDDEETAADKLNKLKQIIGMR